MTSIITEHDADGMIYDRNYLGIARSDDLVIIQITANNTRTTQQKKALFARIVERLRQSPGLRPEDVLINLVETLPENWSFGHGVAQYAKKDA
jgi:4-oxalocrotonate tautomerase